MTQDQVLESIREMMDTTDGKKYRSRSRVYMNLNCKENEIALLTFPAKDYDRVVSLLNDELGYHLESIYTN